MQRIPEPEELMDDPAQALAYARADFTEANSLFVELVERQSDDGLHGLLLDLGCGPADIPILLAHRHTGSFLYHVAKGSGHSTINGQRFDWSEHDIFCVPSWAWHEHANASDREDACLFCLNDLPVMRALGLYREEAFGENGGHQPLTS